jgi:hypothetical protein
MVPATSRNPAQHGAFSTIQQQSNGDNKYNKSYCTAVEDTSIYSNDINFVGQQKVNGQLGHRKYRSISKKVIKKVRGPNGERTPSLSHYSSEDQRSNASYEVTTIKYDKDGRKSTERSE